MTSNLRKTGEPFRIAVDARPLVEPPCGLRRYLECLLPALLDTDPELELHLIANRRLDPSWRTRDRVTVSTAQWPMSALLRPLWEQLQLAVWLRRSGADVFFSAFGAVPAHSSIPVVITVQDLAFLKRPDLLPWRYRVYWKHIAARWSQSRSVVVPSSATRDDLLELTAVDGDRVHVIPHAADPIFCPMDSATETTFRNDLGLPGAFVLWVGTDEPRKNLSLLHRAMERLNAERPSPIPLVVAGRRGWGESADRSPAWLLDVGAVTDENLSHLYSAATVFAFPSVDEGFGLPVVEAMACGCPVVAADTGSLPEILSGAGVVLPAQDADSWARALTRIIDDPAAAAGLRRQSLERAADFSWTATAQRTVALLRRSAAL